MTGLSTALSLEALEELLQVARLATEHAKAAFRLTWIPIRELDVAATQSRSRRRALVESYQMTDRAARKCGLRGSASTRMSLSRMLCKINAETAMLKAVIESAAGPCAACDAAWEVLRAARSVEQEALEAVLAARLTTAANIDVQKLEAEREREYLADLVRQEEAERERELTLAKDPHFDPRYDHWEIAIRRSRPWV